ncbi:MAG: RNA methyltransferase [Anaerolineales bacterium]|nr:RNA methyltransferase [Anaerolineales bacterium]
MPITSFEIRVCLSCGLRYPLAEGNSFGERCPHCLGATETVLTKRVNTERNLTTSGQTADHPQLAVLLDNIRSAWNVGSILRSADGFGFEHAYLCGITPTPQNEAVTKTSLGAEDFVAWSEHKDSLKLVKELKKEGWKIYALEETKKATDIRKKKIKVKEKAVLVLGSEVTGVDPALLKMADETIRIPMQGGKRSFNVSVAFAIAAYALQYGASRRATPKSRTKPRTTSG